MTRPSPTAAAILVAGLVAISLVGVAIAASPSPDASPSPSPEASVSPSSSEPSAESSPAPSVEPSASAAPSVEPSASAAPSVELSPEPSPRPATISRPEDGSTITVTGTLRVVTESDGDTAYAIGDTRLSVGPPWFWGDDHPLAGLVGSVVIVTGEMDHGPSPNANERAKERASGEPELDVFTVNGETVREPGKPPWAGGPKVVGDRHPGYQGWSKNH